MANNNKAEGQPVDAKAYNTNIIRLDTFSRVELRSRELCVWWTIKRFI